MYILMNIIDCYTQQYIWKIYFSLHVIPILINTAEVKRRHIDLMCEMMNKTMHIYMSLKIPEEQTTYRKIFFRDDTDDWRMMIISRRIKNISH